MPQALIIGASRGLGLGLADQFAAHGWEVTGTVRGPSAALSQLAKSSAGKVRIEDVDIRDAASCLALRERLAGEAFDLLLVNAGVGGPPGKTPRDVTDAEFTDLFVANALGPVRLAEMLVKQVKPQSGVIAMMTSLLGSVASNTAGGLELYRASKAALNSLTRSFIARHRDKGLTVLSLHPGWVKTDMGGPGADIEIETSVSGLTRVIERAIADRKDGYFDYKGNEIPW